MRLGKTILCCVALLFFICPPAKADQVRIFKIQYREAAELLPIVKVALSKTGSVTADHRTNSLVVKDKEANLRMVARLLLTQDVPPVNVILKVHTISKSVLSNSGVKVDWKVKNGNWEVGTANVRNDGAFVRLSGSSKIHSSSSATKTRLKVLSGGKGTLVTGSKLVAASDSIEYWEKRGYRFRSANITHLQTGLVVEPMVLKEGVRVKITPVLTYFSAGGVKTKQLTNYRMEVMVKEGQRMLIGADSVSGKTVVSEIFSGFSASGGASNSYLLIEVKVEK